MKSSLEIILDSQLIQALYKGLIIISLTIHRENNRQLELLVGDFKLLRKKFIFQIKNQAYKNIFTVKHFWNIQILIWQKFLSLGVLSDIKKWKNKKMTILIIVWEFW